MWMGNLVWRLHGGDTDGVPVCGRYSLTYTESEDLVRNGNLSVTGPCHAAQEEFSAQYHSFGRGYAFLNVFL